MTYDADTDGVLIEVVAGEGDTLPIGEVIARIGEEGEAPSGGGEKEKQREPAGDNGGGKAEEAVEKADRAKAKAEEAKEELGQPATATAEKPSGGGEADGDGRIKASPVARRMARDLGVELAELEGSGPGGRIVKADVQAAAENGGAKAGVTEKGKAEAADGDGADAAAKDTEAAKKDKKGKK